MVPPYSVLTNAWLKFARTQGLVFDTRGLGRPRVGVGRYDVAHKALERRTRLCVARELHSQYTYRDDHSVKMPFRRGVHTRRLQCEDNASVHWPWMLWNRDALWQCELSLSCCH